MAAAVSQGLGQEEVFVSRAAIQLQLPPIVYEWHTLVVNTPPASPPSAPAVGEFVRKEEQKEAAAKPKGNYYTPPRILGTEAQRKNLHQTLGNFYEVERYASAWNRVTKLEASPVSRIPYPGA
ncbi:uncharacterized protein Dana_GF22796 [Drosophila ananassae]|uniref:Uncharacterized protein n=1 Tax=Drosophila ananassae TaxID=7217 RepID=B3MUY2_DROAN|nr:uncharacterized protein LOC6505449 [Drosophila ananassae]EDV33047.1 uncharacterized protein Dana_GF22796 [Drosophila ananassae]